MHTLTTFPSLLTFGLIAPFVLRIAVSAYIINLGKKRYGEVYKWTSIFYFISGVFLFLGLYTQIAAILGVLVLKFDFYMDFWKNRKMASVSKEMYFLYIISVIVLLSLIFTGPGFFAFDLPL